MTVNVNREERQLCEEIETPLHQINVPILRRLLCWKHNRIKHRVACEIIIPYVGDIVRNTRRIMQH